MWSLLYGVIALFCCWIFTRFIRWQISRWVKAKFDVDTAIRSIGLFSVYDITIRVNQLQTIEIDKVALKLKLFYRDASSRLISLHIGEVRVRGEIGASPLLNTPADESSNSAKTHRRSASTSTPYNKVVNLLPVFFKYVSVHTDMLNIMVLHAFVPDSLLHVNICGIHLASSESVAVEHHGGEHAVTGSLSLQSVEGKILKTPKEASEVTSCIAEISTSIELAVLANRLQPSIELDTVNLDVSKLQIDLHEGALIPGILLPQIKPEHFNRDSQVEGSLTREQLELKLLKVIGFLPTNTILCVRSFGLAFFGDETMGESIRGAHVCSSKIMFRQVKDTANIVPVVTETSRSELKVPSGYVRLIVEDVTMTDYYKHKVAHMGKTVFESKLTANGVLSNSFDFTSWHADYMHKESVEFWSIILNKIQDAQQQKAILRQALYYFPPQDGAIDSRGSRARASSTPDPSLHLSHPDILQGTADAAFQTFEKTPRNSLNISELLRSVDISVVLECTMYDASISVVMSHVDEDFNDDPPSFAVYLDSFTGSVDQSQHSRDFSFMAKTENFNCMVSQDGSSFAGTQPDATRHSNSEYKNGVHQWGRAFNVESLGLHGSASFKQVQNSEEQEISLLIDAKVDGLQAELSKRAAQALSSVLRTVTPHKNEQLNKPTYQRQTTMPLNYKTSPQEYRNEVKKYRYTVACLELELLRVNGFILSSDDTSCADCLVTRFDRVKVEMSGEDDDGSDGFGAGITRKVSVVGVAVSTVHNPTFSAFASYEGGLNGSRTPAARLPPSMRLQQTRAAEHRCVEAAHMTHSHVAFDLLEVCYSAKFNSTNCEVENALPGNIKEAIRRSLSVTLSSDTGILARWSPSLHALIHYEIIDFVSIISPFFKKSSKLKPPESNGNFYTPNKGHEHVTNHGDHNVPPKTYNPIKVKMFGDGASARPRPSTLRPIDLDISVSALIFHFCVSDKQNVKFCLSPLRCLQSRDSTNISFDEFSIIMDDNVILAFSNIAIELSNSNEVCNKDRRLFSDLVTEANRAWCFNIASLKCFFPHKYDFAATFDQSITTFKWVKGLYRKTSHPFRSPRLPPDLLIHISQFTFEIGDWDFESHLRDNHELMKDEWSESEKRRRVLDQRMAELRKTRGELLPAKKVEELYCQLASTNINIYLLRSRKMYNRSCAPVLMIWTIKNFNLTALADESMHGMDNAIRTIRNIDDVSPFPFKRDQDDDPDFVTLWCRSISLHAERHQVRVRNYPQCLMDYTNWKMQGKFCGAEQKGPVTAQRTEYVQLPLPWEPAAVKRNMPALKFYHDLKSEVHTFNMAWGPCWDPAWAQVNLAFNLLTKATVDPSPQLPWWDKSRLLFHGKLAMAMERVNLLHLASLDPYNTTEHMHWDWKNLTFDWLPGRFTFKGDLDIHIRNASKYDDIRFLHLPSLVMDVTFDWICLEGANPHDHHLAVPFSPDQVESSDLPAHDSYRSFRSRNIDLSISLDTTDGSADDVTNDKPEILLYSTTLRWLGNFWYAVNAVTRPISKGAIFDNVTAPKLKLSRHYRNVKLSFQFPQLKACYWSSYTQQLGVELICGAGKVSSHFRLRIVPFEGKLTRRSLGEWSVASTNFDLNDAKIYLLKRQEIEDLAQSPSTRSLGVERNFVLSLSKMSYHRASVADSGGRSVASKGGLGRSETSTSRGTDDFDDTKQWKKRQKKVSSPTKKPQNSQTLVVHDLRAMWTTDNRDVGYGLYEGYSKAAVMRRNLSTKILNKFRVGTSRGEETTDSGTPGRKASQTTPNSDSAASSGFGQKTMDPNEMLHQLLSESGNKFVVGAEDPTTEQQQLKGVAACSMDDVANENWLIKFVNCQAMLKGPKTQGYIIMTASQANFFNRDHKVAWRDGQLTTKSSWIGSLAGAQVFATVGKNVTSSGQDGENVPWLSVGDIAPRGPSPGMLDITDLMGGGQAIGGVVGDGVSAGSFQLQRIVSRCTCKMFYVGYEALVDSEQSDYAHLIPETPMSPEEDKSQLPKDKSSRSSLLGNEKAVNVLTISQPELEICTNTSQFTMIIDIVENLLLYVEPVMREHWERVDRMRFKLRLTSADDAAKHKDTLAAMQSRIRTQLTNMRQLEKQLFRIDRALDKDPENLDLLDESAELRQRLAEDKETLNIHNEELGIIIRCFKEMFLEQKTRTSSLRPQNQEFPGEEDEASVVRTTEVSLGLVKWHLTDADGQLNIAQFEMKDFLYEKVNRSDESVSHCFELAWLCLQNLLPNSQYRDVLKPRHEGGLRTHGVSGAGGRSLTLRVICKVRPPVGGISVKDHVEVNTVPLTIQLSFHFFKRMMSFFFPDKGVTSSIEEEDVGSQEVKDNRGATLLGFPSGNAPQDRYGSLLSLPTRPPPPPSPSSSHSQLSTPGSLRKGRSSTKRDRTLMDAFDDVDKMKERAAKNNSFLYIKITQVPLCVSYKGEKEKNMEDVHEFDVAIPMLEYHSVTWTWHDFAMAVKRDCKKQLLSQLIKKKLHISERSTSHATAGGATEQAESSQAAENNKVKMLLGNTLQRSDSRKKSLLFRKKK